MAAFFCYCSLEQTAMLWFSSFFALSRGIPADTAASWASLFFLGITAGRGVSGFLTAAFDDHTMIRLGQAVILAGLVLLLLPLSPAFGLAGLLLVLSLIHISSEMAMITNSLNRWQDRKTCIDHQPVSVGDILMIDFGLCYAPEQMCIRDR